MLSLLGSRHSCFFSIFFFFTGNFLGTCILRRLLQLNTLGIFDIPFHVPADNNSGHLSLSIIISKLLSNSVFHIKHMDFTLLGFQFTYSQPFKIFFYILFYNSQFFTMANGCPMGVLLGSNSKSFHKVSFSQNVMVLRSKDRAFPNISTNMPTNYVSEFSFGHFFFTV